MHNYHASITQFIIEEQYRTQSATDEFIMLLNDITTACKVISNLINRDALTSIFNSVGSENTHGKAQKKLNIISDKCF